MATQVIARLSAAQAPGSRESRPAAKGLLELWFEYFKLLGVVATIGAVLLVGPVVALLIVTYVAYLLSRLLGA